MCAAFPQSTDHPTPNALLGYPKPLASFGQEREIWGFLCTDSGISARIRCPVVGLGDSPSRVCLLSSLQAPACFSPPSSSGLCPELQLPAAQRSTCCPARYLFLELGSACGSFSISTGPQINFSAVSRFSGELPSHLAQSTLGNSFYCPQHAFGQVPDSRQSAVGFWANAPNYNALAELLSAFSPLFLHLDARPVTLRSSTLRIGPLSFR